MFQSYNTIEPVSYTHLDVYKRQSYIFISHDLGVVKHIADRILVMYLGHVVEEGTSEDIFNHPSHPYTRTLLNAIPTIGVEMSENTLIEGDLPSPSNPPKGCVFHTRCPFAKEECALKQPEVKDPVSYTHLDVYKRQRLCIRSFC